MFFKEQRRKESRKEERKSDYSIRSTPVTETCNRREKLRPRTEGGEGRGRKGWAESRCWRMES